MVSESANELLRSKLRSIESVGGFLDADEFPSVGVCGAIFRSKLRGIRPVEIKTAALRRLSRSADRPALLGLVINRPKQ